MDDYFCEFEKPEEKQMKRSVVSMISILTFCAIGLISSSAMADDDDDRRLSATVSFGQWESDPPLDRIVADPAAGARNNHELIPDIVTITEGGSVNFIISGGHVVTVYDDGTQPGDIGSAIEPNCPATPPAITSPCSPLNTATPPVPAAGGILSHSNNRIYRGAFLNLVRRDGVEVVKFSKPGTYLVICARKNHFENDDMFGFVRVKKAEKDDD